MTIIDYRASARVALRALENDHEFTHKTAQLRQWFPESVLDDIKVETATARSYNEDMAAGGSALLSPDASAYWSQVQLVIRKGKAAQRSGNRAAEKAVSLAAERLAETFDHVVPECDKPKFAVFDPQRNEETWDDRWAFVEHEPPVLKPEFERQHRIDSPVNYAQRLVLSSIAQPEFDAEVFERSMEQGRKLRELAIRLAAGKAETPKKPRVSKTETEASKRKKRLREIDKAMGIKRTKFKQLERIEGIIEVPKYKRPGQ